MTISVPFIRPNGCKNCKHKVRAPNGLECHFNPPVTHPKMDGVQMVGMISLWSMVQPDWICAQHKPNIALAASPSGNALAVALGAEASR